MLRPLLQNNLRAVRERIERAARRAGRDPADVHLVAVTKSVGAEVALELARLGERELGENRVDGFEPKAARFEDEGVEVRWHFIGHLQGNKARRVVRLADAIHSVDSLKLLERLDELAGEEGRRPRVFLEVKLSPEDAKQGFDPAAVPAAARRAAEAAHLRFAGLMTMAPVPDSDSERDANLVAARGVFDALVTLGRELEGELAEQLEGGRLRYSMGMSDDFETAIEAGSDFVRIGGALFTGLDLDAAAARRPADGDARALG